MKVTKAQYDALPKDLQKLFKAVTPDGGEEADATEYDNGEEDAKAIKSARDRERDAAKALREEKKAWETEKAELEGRVEELESGGEKAGGDVKALKDSYEKKLTKQKTTHETEMTKVRQQLDRVYKDAVADKIAAEISTVPKFMAREIASRLRVNLDGDEPVTEVLSADGKPSAATLDELKQEILGNKEYAGILIGSKGSGGGAGGGGGEGGAFDIKDYRNQDGSTNWSKVSEGMKSDPKLLEKVKSANATTPVAPAAQQ